MLSLHSNELWEYYGVISDVKDGKSVALTKKKDIEIPHRLSHNFFFFFKFLVSPLIWKLRHFFFATVSFGPVLGWGQFSARVRPRHAQHVKCSEWLTYDMVLICGDMILFRYKVFEVSQTTSSTIIPQHPGLDLCDALQRHYRVHTHCCSSSDISSKVAGKYLQEAKPQIKNLPK